VTTASPADRSAILARRARLLSPTYRLFYEQPLQIVRAEGVWMYDEHGRAYLDAYNNVPVVGHCHPYVVNALARQARTLNTHTRYLAEQPLQLAEELLGTMPPELGNVIFTCTGSEANDLAVRVSKAVTGGTGFIVTDFAYHGVTDVLAGMSPEDGGVLGPGVYAVPSPAAAGGAAAFGEHVRACIDRMRDEGVRLAALLTDTIFSSDGVFADPKGFLTDAVRHVQAAGGLFIADEVQPGFGAWVRRCGASSATVPFRTSSRWGNPWETGIRLPPWPRVPRSWPGSPSAGTISTPTVETASRARRRSPCCGSSAAKISSRMPATRASTCCAVCVHLPSAAARSARCAARACSSASSSGRTR